MSDETLDEVIQQASQSPQHAARTIAIHFYKALRRANFNDKDIINIATEILDCLHQSLKGYKQKLGEEGDSE